MSTLRAAREACNLSRVELAHRVGCSPRTIEAIEQGERDASPAMWGRLEQALVRSAAAHITDVRAAVAACAHLDHADAAPNGNGRVRA
jgi:DNA-binding XRE family transcriptional regulator